MGRRLTVVLMLCAQVAYAQQAEVGVQEGQHYVGEPVLVRVTARGFDEDPQPDCQWGALPPGLSLKAVGVRPSVSSVTQMINGRVSTYRRVTFAFDFHAVAGQSGTYRVPPFTVKQAGREVRTTGFNLQMRDIEADGDMRVMLVLPSNSVYPGQRVPVTVEWWYAGDLDQVRDLAIRTPLFDRFSFIDEEVTRDDTALPIQTAKGTLKVKATVGRQNLNGKSFVVISAKRLLVVEQPGTFELEPITASIEKVTRWGMGFFGRREPVATVKLRAVGKPQTLQIKPLPLDDAPPSFAGAVGQGFTIDVKADRTVLRAGDPIVLSITVRGDGHLDQAGPPRLSAQGGLDPQRFRLPVGELAGRVTDAGKQFSMTVRVRDESVAEIPPIAYAWFDPASERFETAFSAPIALRVLPTQMVTAHDVVSGQESAAPASDAKESGSEPPLQAAETVGPAAKIKPYDLTGADLAIQTDVQRLLTDESRRFGGDLTHAAVYGGSLMVVLLAWWRRCAAQADPKRRQQRKAFRDEVRCIHRAAKLPRREGAGQVAVALRRLVAHANGHRRDEIDQLLAQCDAVAFSPAGDDPQPLDAALHQRALAIAQAVGREVC